MYAEPPLHQAILDGDVSQITALAQYPENLLKTNQYGLSPFDLAHFLGKSGYLNIPPSPQTIKVLLKDENQFQEFSQAAFKKEMGVSYLSWLRFDTYQLLLEARKNCPWLLWWKWSGKENQDLATQYQQQLFEGSSPLLTIKWISNELGYGLFADQDFESGDYIGEYTGVVRKIDKKRPVLNEYCLQYPTKYWSRNYFVIDAQQEGNFLRYANHSDHPNMRPATAMDRGWLHQLFFANQKIKKGTQLTFNYGQDFWIKRKKIPVLD